MVCFRTYVYKIFFFSYTCILFVVTLIRVPYNMFVIGLSCKEVACACFKIICLLTDTSVKHSPNFDWVVAHVGSCFPNTVITRVLTCGLKDFCQNKSYEQGCESPKLKSVVGILGHLAGSHSADIQMALLYLFNVSYFYKCRFF